MIDIAALRRVARGDPEDRVRVNRRWLKAVLAEMEELEKFRRKELAGAKKEDNFLGPVGSALGGIIKEVFGTNKPVS